MYNKTYSYYVNPSKRLFCSDAQGTPIATLPNLYFGERPVFTMTFDDGVLVEGEKLVFVMDNENRFLDSHSITGLEPVMAWCVHEITAEDVQNKSIDLELYCFGRKYADVINGHDNAVTCILSLFIKSIDENLNCTFSTLATTLAYAEPTIVSPDCVFDELPIDMYLTRDEMNALITEVEAIQREAIEKAEQARQSAAVAEAAAQEASQIAKDLKPLQLSAPPTTSTSGSVGQLAVWHDAEANKDHLYHLCFISTSENATLYHWEECVLVSMGNVAGGYPVLDSNGKVAAEQLHDFSTMRGGSVGANIAIGFNQNNTYRAGLAIGANNNQTSYNVYNNLMAGESLRANANFQTVLGKYNAIGDQLFIVGNGTGSNNRSNAMSVDSAGNTLIHGDYQQQIVEIPTATSDYTFVEGLFSHVPTQAPTYRLPSVSDTTISHYIELTVDFTNVQTYSFLDANGDALVPLFTPSIAVGDVYTFKMEYSAIKAAWLIYPQKQGAVADDFVMRGEVGAANGVAGLDGNAKVPQGQLTVAGTIISSTDLLGCIKVGTTQGFRVFNGYLNLRTPTDEAIASRSGVSAGFGAITTNNLNKAVTAAITDANHITLNNAQKAAAQEVFGIGGPITEIPAATSEYTLSEGIFKHSPTNAPTYNLPAITDTIRSHVIVLAIDFSSVQTFSFVPPQDSGVTFQTYANPNMGDVWVFRCVWYGGKWRIAPMKIKNCVTRQLTSGALSITDAVVGDALALKMVAPRSVVVNQLIYNGNFTDTTGWVIYNGSMTVTNNVIEMELTSAPGTVLMQNREISAFNGVANHTYLARYDIYMPYSDETILRFRQDSGSAISAGVVNVTANTWTTCVLKWTPTANFNNMLIYPSRTYTGWAVGDVFKVRNFMLVDLTQYFNGDSTLIDSITSWDDLVAYDPRFASYVQYNTGTVEGVTPRVKVTGKNLLDDSITAISGVYVYIGSINDSGGSILGAGTYTAKVYRDGVAKDYKMYIIVNGSLHTSIYGGSGSFTLTKPAKIFIKLLKAVVTDATGITLQLELGSVATPYEPYHDSGTETAPSELFAVDNAADEFEAVSGVTTQAVGTFTFTGTETPTSWGSHTPGYYAVYFPAAMIPDLTHGPGNVLCSFLPTRSYGDMWADYTVVGISAGSSAGTGNQSLFIRVPTSTSSDATSLMAWLTGKTVYYVKTTPAEVQGTPAQISLQAGSNVAMQTDGGRLAPIDITYESNEI